MRKFKMNTLMAVSLVALMIAGRPILCMESDIPVPVGIGDRAQSLRLLKIRSETDPIAITFYNEADKTIPLMPFQEIIKRYNSSRVAKQASKEEREENKKLEKQKEKLERERQSVAVALKASEQATQTEMQKTFVAEQALALVSGMEQTQVRVFLESLQSALRGFSDGIFMMKFSGDETPEFATTLMKISKQADLSVKMKKKYEEDKGVKKLDVFLQLPSRAIDLDPLNQRFVDTKTPLAATLQERIQEFRELVAQVKSDLESIRKKSDLDVSKGGLAATEEDVQYFEKYWLDNSETGEENKEYKRIFESAEWLISFYSDLIDLLNNQYQKPTDFKKRSEILFKKHEEVLLADFSEVVGGDRLKGEIRTKALKIDSPQFLLVGRSGLSLYHYLRIRKDEGSPALQKHIAKLMENIKKMRIAAYQLKRQLVETMQEEFVKSDEADLDLPKEPKMIQELFTYVDDYEKALEENSLHKNLKKFMHPSGEFTSLKKMRDHQTKSIQAEKTIIDSMKKLISEWEKIFSAKIDFYQAKKVKTLKGILLSKFYKGDKNLQQKQNDIVAALKNAEKSKAKLALDSYLTELLKKMFEPLGKNAHRVDFRLLFDEPKAVKEARKLRNEKIEQENASSKATVKKPLEETPPLSLERTNIGTLMRLQLNVNDNLSFDEFWSHELSNEKSDLCTFMKSLSTEESKSKVREICKLAFEFIKGNTEEQKQLYNLFQRVIEAHKCHETFIQRMEVVKASFESLKSSIPNYGLEQQPISKKVQQLQILLEKKSDIYLNLEPDERAVNYAYNFPMFYEEGQKPLDSTDQKMKVWGTADDSDFDQALKEAHHAYIQARDAIQAINPVASEDKRSAIRLGGFHEESKLVEESQPTQQHPQQLLTTGPQEGPNIKPSVLQMVGDGPLLKSSQRGGPLQRGGQLQRGGPLPARGQRGSNLQSVTSINVSDEDQVTEACNKYYEAILKVVGEQHPLANDKEMISQTELDSRQNAKQLELVESITANLVKAALDDMIQNLICGFYYQYIDNPRPEILTVLDIIARSEASFKTKERFDEILKAELTALKLKEEKAISRMGKSMERFGTQSKGALEHEGGNTLQISLRKTKVDHEPVAIDKLIKAEEDLLKTKTAALPTGAKLLKRIKKFLVSEKGADFVASFADGELMAFPLWAVVGLESTDLEHLAEGFDVDHLKGRKFSNGVLESIQEVRFNKNPEERIKSRLLSSQEIKTGTPRYVLSTLLQVNSSKIMQLSSEGHIR